MTVRNLDIIARVRSVAVIGLGDGPGSVGEAILRNVRAGGFTGEVWPVDPGRDAAEGLPCFANVADLPGVPDLAVVALAPEAVPAAIADLGARGCRVAVVTTRGMTVAERQAMLDAARPHLLRIVGPNSSGLLVPAAALNASLAPGPARPGRLALLSQSAAVAATMLGWAAERGIGFSQVITLGDMADVDVGDALDLLAMDGATRAILLYLESIPNPRKFLSAARVAARLKPVIALKAGRSPEAADAAATHSGALSGAEAVVDAALRRAGILRVRGLSEMFAAAETVGRFRPMQRGRLAIVTNGGGPGVLAVDYLVEAAGSLADLAAETLARLGAVLPAGAAPANPVDLGAAATGADYAAALDALAADPAVDAILVMNGPTVLADPLDAALAVAGQVRDGLLGTKPVFACWMGGAAAREARRDLRARGIASYDTPASGAAAVGHLTEWGRAQAALLRVPDRSVEADPDATGQARARVAAVFAAVARAGRRVLTEPEAAAVLAAYGIPTPELRLAPTPAAVGAAAAQMLEGGGRLVVKLVSGAIHHKSDLGGVALDIATAADAEAAARAIATRAEAAGVALDGFALQPMIRRPEARELILGIGRDPVFGPVILFGSGGLAVELLDDTAIDLPPLDTGLAATLVARTRASALLAGYRGRAPADAAALHAALVALSHLIEDFPCIRTADVNPLIADADGVLALDAQMVIEPGDLDRPAPNPDLAIRPYPGAWRRSVERNGAIYRIRPIRPEDAHLYPVFLEHTDPDDLRLRFLAPRRNFSDEFALRLTQLDYDREMAFVALTPEGELAGVARVSCDPDRVSGEYAMIVRSDLQGRGLGGALMRMLIDYATADGLRRLEGMVLAENRGMLAFVDRLGFGVAPDPDEPGVMQTRLDLGPLADADGRS